MMEIKKTESGMNRLNDAEVNIGRLDERTSMMEKNINEIKLDLKEKFTEIFGRLGKTEVRLGIIFAIGFVLQFFINMILKLWR